MSELCSGVRSVISRELDSSSNSPNGEFGVDASPVAEGGFVHFHFVLFLHLSHSAHLLSFNPP